MAKDQPAPRLPRAPEKGLARPLERRRLQAYLTMLVGDIAIILVSFAVCSVIYLKWIGDAPAITNGIRPAVLLLPVYITITLYSGTYTRAGLTNWQASGSKAVTALLIAAALLNFFAFFAKINEGFSRGVFILGMTSSIFLIFGFRLLLSRWILRTWGPSSINRLVIQAGGPAIALPHSYHIDAAEHGLRPDIEDPAALDRLGRYLRNMDQVLVSCAESQRVAWAEVLKGSGVRGEVIDPFVHEIGAVGVVRHPEAGIATLLVSAGHLDLRSRAIKRLFDIVVSLFGLLALSPLMLACALAIKLEDGGPVFFRQRRMGRGNRFFEIYKFRSMGVEKADANADKLVSKNDDRVTRVGKLIRSTSIDELPQLLNVLRGDMSIVGPRPHALGALAGSTLYWRIDRRYSHRHSLRPGITGLAQIRGYRGATDTEVDLTNRLRSDLEYLRDWSLWGDVKIIFATFGVLMHEQAF